METQRRGWVSPPREALKSIEPSLQGFIGNGQKVKVRGSGECRGHSRQTGSRGPHP